MSDVGGLALVVGGYGGIGAAISADLARHGASVVVAGRDGDAAEKLAAGLPGPVPASGVAIDICDEHSVERGIAEVVDRQGELSMVVNCASVLEVHPAAQFPAGSFRRVVEANLVGPFLLSQAVGRRMIAAGTKGRIVHLSSVRAAAGARRGFSAYGSSKAGLNLLVRQLATEWGGHGITVNAVAPGFVPTGFVQGVRDNDSMVAQMRQRIPLGRFAEPGDVAAAVRYLLSTEAGFVTGQILHIDGGVTASQ